ncbi:MAG: hypothetical protein J0M04_16360 [Verrucomicrobia bacterium]|nr:hypothetical protein [Verrucomicrobiota bacterium]
MVGAQQIQGDLFTPLANTNTRVDASWGMTHYVRLLVEGKSWQQITDFFNAKGNRMIEHGESDPTPLKLYDFHSFNN